MHRPGAEYQIKYAAGIPQRANVMWPEGGTPKPESGEQAANLDNNTGESTRETAPETTLTNHAEVGATFEGDPEDPEDDLVVADSTTHSVAAEDCGW